MQGIQSPASEGGGVVLTVSGWYIGRYTVNWRTTSWTHAAWRSKEWATGGVGGAVVGYNSLFLSFFWHNAGEDVGGIYGTSDSDVPPEETLECGLSMRYKIDTCTCTITAKRKRLLDAAHSTTAASSPSPNETHEMRTGEENMGQESRTGDTVTWE